MSNMSAGQKNTLEGLICPFCGHHHKSPVSTTIKQLFDRLISAWHVVIDRYGDGDVGKLDKDMVKWVKKSEPNVERMIVRDSL